MGRVQDLRGGVGTGAFGGKRNKKIKPPGEKWGIGYVNMGGGVRG